MDNYSGFMPQNSHGGEQVPSQKMPSALPNGGPPQWGQEVDYKSPTTSQFPTNAAVTNGLRSSSHHSHPGSLSSHSSRDSSPAPSRIGIVHPSTWSPASSQNHSSPIINDTSASSQMRYQQISQPSPGAGPTVSHSQPQIPAPTSNTSSNVDQNMPPAGQVPTRLQGVPSSLSAEHVVGGTSSPTLGQRAPNAPEAVNNFNTQTTSQTLSAMSVMTSQPQGYQASSTAPQNAPGPQYSQTTGMSLGPQPSSLLGQAPPRPLGKALPIQTGFQGSASPIPPMQAPASQALPSGAQQIQPSQAQLPPAQQGPVRQIAMSSRNPMALGPGQQNLSSPVQSVTQNQGQQLPPVSAQQNRAPVQQMQYTQRAPSGPGNFPPGPQMPPPMGQQMPPSAVQQIPPPSRQQAPPPSGQYMPPGPQQMAQTGQYLSSGPGQQLPPGPRQQMPPISGQNMFAQIPQRPPMQPPSAQWSAGPSLGGPQRPPYPVQQGLTSPPTAHPYNNQQPMSMNSMASQNQLSGPALSRPYIPNHAAQATGLSGSDGFRRYPQHGGPDGLTSPMSNLSVTQSGYDKLWGQENFDLLQSRNILPREKVEPPKIRLAGDFQHSVNCSPDIFRCTLTRIPQTDSLLKKSRLPLGVLIHPFRDLSNLPVMQCTPIVRCRNCRTYINPFVYFMDEKHWKCNLCFRVNDIPEEFQFDPTTKTYGEPMRRPEVKSATIEYIAPAEYMLRPPQPAVYLFLLDVSRLAVESGYLQIICGTLLAELDNLPGDGRTSIGFITYDSTIHFYSLAEGLSTPQQMVVMDIDDVFLPCPENLLANLGERKELVQNLLLMLPTKFSETFDTGSALGAALQAAFKLLSPTGGRVTVFQCCLPNKGPGTLKAREDPSNRASKDVPHLNPATDFYKQLALEFSGQQTAVDMFLLNQQYSDLATISGVSKFSGGCIHHFPLFQASNIQLVDSFESCLRRYLERKIGFEAVMRIRCSRGLSIHTFHGNFYVRSTDLLSLPNINPDAGFGMQVSIEENLSDMQHVCLQAALLYTSGKGERRIRVHTLCLPIAAGLPEILHGADQQCIIGLLAKMAVDRSQQSSLSDARDAFINVVIDALSAYKAVQSSAGAGLLAPSSLKLLPLYILALLKNPAFRSGTNTRLDDRVFAMCQMKTLPLCSLIQFIYPDLYPVHYMDSYEESTIENIPVKIPPRLQLSAEKVNSQGAFLLDAGDEMLLLVGRAISPVFCENILGVPSFSAIPEDMFELPEIDCEDSRILHQFITYLQSQKPYYATLHVIREDSKSRHKFFERLIEDRTESSLAYYEFLQHIKNQIK